jgi:prepilin-type N-terminal cleavage/methylation domain-containing protein
MMKRKPPSHPRGFSLLEILLSLAILGGSLAVLSQIVGTGGDAGRNARELEKARILCQSKLTELLVANLQPTAVNAMPVVSPDSESDIGFVYSVEIGQPPLSGLIAMKLTVEAINPDGGPSIASYTIHRWMIDPLLGLEQTESEDATSETTASETSPPTELNPKSSVSGETSS